MSSYKVIQDIEAEDKLIGPLTLRQSIYAGITMVCLYICFLAFTKNAVFLIGMFLPVAAITGFFAFPWKGEQPTEIWALARLRFMIKPRVRVWDQSGVKDVVTVLAPRKLETRRLTNNLSEIEVRSRLKALADTIDSRGWATRNASYALYSSQYQSRVNAPGQTAPTGVSVADDMFDAHSNVAQNLDAMLARSSQDQRQRVMQQMAQAQAPQPMPQPVSYSQGPQLPAPVMTAMSSPAPGGYAGPPMYQQPPTPANNLGVTPMQNMQPNGQNNYWFANGPGYPGSPAPGQVTPPPAMTPAPPPLPDNRNPVANSTIPEPYAAAVSAGKISADVPIVAAATPTDDELAFAEAARRQQELERQRYNHVRVVDPASGAVTTPQLSVPGMIDYGRPQPTEDQMQYDTSMPQTNNNPAGLAPANPVTRTPDPAILDLAKNDDLDVATIARQAGKDLGKMPGEVEVKLR